MASRLDNGARTHPELGVEKPLERPVLPLGRVVVAGEAVQPDHERLVVLVERAHRRRAHREAPGPVELAAGEQTQGGLVEHRLGSRGEPPPLREQPRLEGRRSAQHRALEQVATGHLHGLGPRTVGQRDDVDQHVVGEGQRHRVTLDRAVIAQGAADLGQAPAQRPQGVVRLGEEELRETPPAGGPFGEDQVGQQRPALATAQPVGLLADPLHPRSAEQADDQHRGRGTLSVAGHPDRHPVSVAQAGPGGTCAARPGPVCGVCRQRTQECSL